MTGNRKDSYPLHACECVVSTHLEALACPAHIAKIARQHGFDDRSCAELQIIASEICTNIVRHGERGVIRYWTTPDPGIIVVAEDEGPGIHDIEYARRDGWSRGDWLANAENIRREGLGTGLGTLERLADHVEITNLDGGGARVAVFKSAKTQSLFGAKLPRGH